MEEVMDSYDGKIIACLDMSLQIVTYWSADHVLTLALGTQIPDALAVDLVTSAMERHLC